MIKDGQVWFNDSSGDVDGITYFIWDKRNQDMLRKLYPSMQRNILNLKLVVF